MIWFGWGFRPKQQEMGFTFSLKTYAYVLGLLLVLALARLAYVGLFPKGTSAQPHSSGQHKPRLSIFDRKGHVLAMSLEAYNVYFNPQKRRSKEAIKLLSEVLGADAKQLENTRKVSLVKRFVSSEVAGKLASSKQEAILLEKVFERLYPGQELLSQSLGFVGFEGKGLTGFEKSYDDFLSQPNQSSVWGTGEFEKPGLYLTFDLELQRKVEQLLEQAIKEHEADSGSVLIQEVATGKVRAIANWPQFNLNAFHTYAPKLFNNGAFSRNIEPGSIFKVFFVAYLMEATQLNPAEKRYTSRGAYVLPNGEFIRDAKAYGAVSLQDIVKHSINGGIVEACSVLSQREMQGYLSRFQFDKRLALDFPGGARAILPPKSKTWGVRTKATIPMGHGIALSPIRMINAFSALVGDGLLKRPLFVERRISYSASKGLEVDETPLEVLGIVVGEGTAVALRRVLGYGTSKGSTGELANASGYRSLGKTGTSQMVDFERGGYHTNKYHSLFVGAYPADEPRVSVLVLLNNPKKQHSGGRVAAPLYAKILPEAIWALGLPDPKRPLRRVPVPSIARPVEGPSSRPKTIEVVRTPKNNAEKDPSTEADLPFDDEQTKTKEGASVEPEPNPKPEPEPNPKAKVEEEVAEPEEPDNNLPEVVPGKMPDFTGLPPKEALLLLERVRSANPSVQIRHSVVGDGYVRKQSFRAGKTLKENKKIHLKLHFRDEKP